MKLEIVLSDILNCGYADISFITDLEENFCEFDWSRVVPEGMDANSVIYSILDAAVSQVCEELNIDRGSIEDNVYIFCNCLDSHLHLKDENGNAEKMYDIDEIRFFLTKNYSQSANFKEDGILREKKAQKMLNTLLRGTKEGKTFESLREEKWKKTGYYYNEKIEKYVAFNNSSFQCFVEEFESEWLAYKWLVGND
ncbi:MAG: hypothetical protein LBI60_04725 [Bacteroidales bacterium]|jgi:hypothetical protein|nr:hypothetical protein [Bacteroidales bacterium]